MSSETIEKDSKRRVRTEAKDAEDREDSRDDERDDERDDDEGDDEERENGASKAVEAASSKEKVVIDRPSSTRMVWTIARRELAAYFHSPISYIVISASLVVLGLYFFFYKSGFWDVNRATMTRMFDALPFALSALVIPLFTMRSLSDEKRVGTIELLITMPVKDSEVILGKYFAALAMVSVQIALVAIYPLAMFKWPWHIGELDWNPFWVGMLGLLLLSAAGTAIGVMWSSFTESQILSYFATMLTLLALYAVGSVTIVEFLQGWPGDAIAFISLQSRFDPFARGIVDTRAVLYFLSLTILCLLVAFRSLESRKWT